jgi:hypothetical protein
MEHSHHAPLEVSWGLKALPSTGEIDNGPAIHDMASRAASRRSVATKFC